MNRVWTVIVCAGVGTYAMRASFIAAAHRLTRVPPSAQRLMRQIPPAALAALVLPALVRPEGSIDLTHPRFIAAAAAALVAWRTGNVLLTLLAGMISLMVLQAL